MGAFSSRRFLILTFLALVLFFAGLLTYVSFQLKEVKDPLLTFLKSKIQGDIQIEAASVSLLPPGLHLKNVKLFAPGDPEPAATIEVTDLRFKLFPLLQRNIDTRIYIRKPSLRMVLGTDGKNNFEKIFEPLLAGNAPPNSGVGEKLWWNRLAVSKLVIEGAHFSSSEQRNATPTEIQNLEVEANDIRFDSSEPARLKIRFDIPKISKESVKIVMQLALDEKNQLIKVKEGKASWGAAEIRMGGEALLPNSQRKNVELALNFSLADLDLKKFAKGLVKPLEINGDLACQGKITGSAFSPQLNMSIDSKNMNLPGKNISRLHAEFIKKDKVIEISKASFEIFNGKVVFTGSLLPEKTISGTFKLNLQGLSVAAMSGKPHPAVLSGQLEVKGSNVEDPRSFGGEGNIRVAPIPLPVVDLKDKIKIAQILTDGVLMSKTINLDFLSSSSNVIGSQINQFTSAVSFSGDDITFNSFHLSNDRLSASGSGSVRNQKTLKASGTATLSTAVTTLLFPDPNFRYALTGGKGVLSVPFQLSGTVDNPDFSINSEYLKQLIAKSAAASLKNIILGNQKPSDLINSALKGTPLGNLPLPPSNSKTNKPKNFEQFFFGR